VSLSHSESHEDIAVSLEERLSVAESLSLSHEISLENVDISLESRVSTEESRSEENDISLELRLFRNELNLSSEVSRAESDELSLDIEIDESVSSERSRALSAELELLLTISAEISRANATESRLEFELLEEESFARSQEVSLESRVSTLELSLSSEVSRAIETESSIEDTLASEISRATAEEATLSEALSAFASVANFTDSLLEQAINGLASALDDEVTRTDSVEAVSDVLVDRVAVLETEVFGRAVELIVAPEIDCTNVSTPCSEATLRYCNNDPRADIELNTLDKRVSSFIQDSDSWTGSGTISAVDSTSEIVTMALRPVIFNSSQTSQVCLDVTVQMTEGNGPSRRRRAVFDSADVVASLNRTLSRDGQPVFEQLVFVPDIFLEQENLTRRVETLELELAILRQESFNRDTRQDQEQQDALAAAAASLNKDADSAVTRANSALLVAVLNAVLLLVIVYLQISSRRSPHQTHTSLPTAAAAYVSDWGNNNDRRKSASIRAHPVTSWDIAAEGTATPPGTAWGEAAFEEDEDFVIGQEYGNPLYEPEDEEAFSPHNSQVNQSISDMIAAAASPSHAEVTLNETDYGQDMDMGIDMVDLDAIDTEAQHSQDQIRYSRGSYIGVEAVTPQRRSEQMGELAELPDGGLESEFMSPLASNSRPSVPMSEGDREFSAVITSLLNGAGASERRLTDPDIT
jgi:hypothetical protein